MRMFPTAADPRPSRGSGPRTWGTTAGTRRRPCSHRRPVPSPLAGRHQGFRARLAHVACPGDLTCGLNPRVPPALLLHESEWLARTINSRRRRTFEGFGGDPRGAAMVYI